MHRLLIPRSFNDTLFELDAQEDPVSDQMVKFFPHPLFCMNKEGQKVESHTLWTGQGKRKEKKNTDFGSMIVATL